MLSTCFIVTFTVMILQTKKSIPTSQQSVIRQTIPSPSPTVEPSTSPKTSTLPIFLRSGHKKTYVPTSASQIVPSSFRPTRAPNVFTLSSRSNLKPIHDSITLSPSLLHTLKLTNSSSFGHSPQPISNPSYAPDTFSPTRSLSSDPTYIPTTFSPNSSFHTTTFFPFSTSFVSCDLLLTGGEVINADFCYDILITL